MTRNKLVIYNTPSSSRPLTPDETEQRCCKSSSSLYAGISILFPPVVAIQNSHVGARSRPGPGRIPCGMRIWGARASDAACFCHSCWAGPRRKGVFFFPRGRLMVRKVSRYCYMIEKHAQGFLTRSGTDFIGTLGCESARRMAFGQFPRQRASAARSGIHTSLYTVHAQAWPGDWLGLAAERPETQRNAIRRIPICKSASRQLRNSLRKKREKGEFVPTARAAATA